MFSLLTSPAVADEVALFILTLLQMSIPVAVFFLVFAASAIGGLWLVEELSRQPGWRQTDDWQGRFAEGTWTEEP